MPIKLNTEQFEQILFEELQDVLLAEGRKDKVKKKYANLDKLGYIDHMSMEDPSGNNAYLAWMAKQLNNMITKEPDMPLGHKEELLSHTVKAVRAFHGNKQRLKDKDINQYKTLPDLNKAIGGSERSQHCKGEAVDIEVPGTSNYEVAKYIRDNLDFDQLILEFYTPGIPDSGWVHVSYKSEGNRKQVLTALKEDGKTVYKPKLIA